MSVFHYNMLIVYTLCMSSFIISSGFSNLFIFPSKSIHFLLYQFILPLEFDISCIVLASEGKDILSLHSDNLTWCQVYIISWFSALVSSVSLLSGTEHKCLGYVKRIQSFMSWDQYMDHNTCGLQFLRSYVDSNTMWTNILQSTTSNRYTYNQVWMYDIKYNSWFHQGNEDVQYPLGIIS